MQDFNIQMKLSLEGIGVALSEEDGFAVVQQVIPGGPADRLKALEPNDRVIAVAEEGKQPVDVIDMALRDIVRLIRGRAGSKVQLTVLRQAEKTERFQVAIVRDKIDLEEQAAKLEVREVPAGGRMLKLGVLDLPSFYGDGDPDPRKRQASRDVRRLLEDAKRQRVDGLVLDLSRNGGGLLDDAVKLSGYFIRAGGIVGVREASERSRIHHDPDAGIVYGGPLVVLTSRVSASASEILVGALQDYRRAVVVGDDHTFGKGTVQSLISLPPGDPLPKGGIKITTGMFFRPGGESTQHAGVASDVRLPSLLASDEIGESAQPNALPVERIAPFASRVANDAANGWRPLTPELIAELARRSQERVGKDKYFVEIEKKLAERAADDGVTKLAEILAEQEEAKRNDLADARPTAGAGNASLAPPPGAPVNAKKEDEAPNPHLDEALRVLADLVQLSA
jgi:carboxyl-terminal processing protease